MDNGEIVLYSTHCPKCQAIEMILKNKKINFELEDNKEEVLSVADSNGIKEMPFAKIGDKIYNCKELQKWIKEH